MKKWLPVLILAIAQFVMILDGTVMNVSISTVAKDLGTSITGMQTAITVFTLTMAAFMLTGGKLGDIWGRRKAFKIGSVVYAIGSMTTALAPTLGVLFVGWSIVEGLGAVLVIPAIASLAAANYEKKDRVIAFSLLGAAMGLAAAVGPIIGGFVTTYFSWRYVFAAETIVMAVALLFAYKIKDAEITGKTKLDVPSVILSALGMILLVFGVLQSRSWGWISPLAKPEIHGVEIAPLGISVVAYLIVLGIIVLKLFSNRQRKLVADGKQAFLNPALLKIPVLKSGLLIFAAQYFAIASIFFIIPVYLQVIIGYDALQTGLKLLPLSVGMLIFTIIGSRRTGIWTTRRIVRTGQLAMAVGALCILGSISVELKESLFLIGMFFAGIGFGLLASQLGNSNMSAVQDSQTGEAGGLQGVAQNLGSSFGTALAGSVFILTLTSGFTAAVQSNPDLSAQAKTVITQDAAGGVGIVSKSQAEQYVIAQGGSQETADEVAGIYQNSQLDALRYATFFIFCCLLLSIFWSKNLSSTLAERS
jgi:MFS family permease